MALGRVLWEVTLGTWKRQLSICGGPVCSFKGFQFGTRRAILASELEDPDQEVAQPLRGIGGLHQVVLEHQFFICRIQVKEENKETKNSNLYSLCDR
jgi:hypothetical protein